MNKKYILWDNDGVLVDTEEWYYEANRKALAEVGIDLKLDDYLTRMQNGFSAWDLAREEGYSEEEIGIHKKNRDQYYRDFLLSEDITIPGVEDVLQKLSKKYKMAIITTSERVNFDLIHGDRNFLKYMDFCLTVEDYPKSKPAPDPYLAGMKKFNAQPEECVVVEDSARGLKAAIAAGIDCIVVRNKFTESHDFTGAKMIINSIKDLPGVLE